MDTMDIGLYWTRKAIDGGADWQRQGDEISIAFDTYRDFYSIPAGTLREFKQAFRAAVDGSDNGGTPTLIGAFPDYELRYRLS
jgi:hypothetical protein